MPRGSLHPKRASNGICGPKPGRRGELSRPSDEAEPVGLQGGSSPSEGSRQGAVGLLAALGLAADEPAWAASRRASPRHSHLQRLIAADSSDLAALVDQAKREGALDEALSTGALVLFFQALSIGMCAAAPTGGGNGPVPLHEEFGELLAEIAGHLGPPSP